MDNEIEVMRVLRVPPMGKLVVEVSGQRYERLADVAHPALRQRLMAAVGELIVFADGYKKLVDAGVAPPLMAEPAVRPDAVEPGPPELEAQRAAFLASMERQRDAMAAEANMTPNPANVISAATRNEPPAAAGPPSNIVGQIDAILQKHVRAEPKLEGRSIHLEQAPAGGLRIKVDNQVYQRPAEIREKEVQLVIKMALKEWEAL
jgi:hypothetical protein